jgi:hypothetical protein
MMDNDVWQNLKAKLAVPYWRANSQGLEAIEWEREILALKQLVMTGSALEAALNLFSMLILQAWLLILRTRLVLILYANKIILVYPILLLLYVYLFIYLFIYLLQSLILCDNLKICFTILPLNSDNLLFYVTSLILCYNLLSLCYKSLILYCNLLSCVTISYFVLQSLTFVLQSHTLCYNLLSLCYNRLSCDKTSYCVAISYLVLQSLILCYNLFSCVYA